MTQKYESFPHDRGGNGKLPGRGKAWVEAKDLGELAKQKEGSNY